MNTLQNSANVLGESLTNVIVGLVNFLPNLLIAAVFALIGWICGGILGRAVSHIVSMLKIDSALKSAGLSQMLNGVNFSVAKLLGGIVKWGIIIAFLVAATQQVGLDAFAGFLYIIAGYMPNVIVAAMILIASFLLADFVGKSVSSSAKAAGMSGGVAGAISRYAIIIVGALAALSQLKIAAGFTEILFTGLVASVSLALGLAFGLGGREAAAKMLNKMENHFE